VVGSEAGYLGAWRGDVGNGGHHEAIASLFERWDDVGHIQDRLSGGDRQGDPERPTSGNAQVGVTLRVISPDRRSLYHNPDGSGGLPRPDGRVCPDDGKPRALAERARARCDFLVDGPIAANMFLAGPGTSLLS
jgi:hypothetical protein